MVQFMLIIEYDDDAFGKLVLWQSLPRIGDDVYFNCLPHGFYRVSRVYWQQDGTIDVNCNANFPIFTPEICMQLELNGFTRLP